jgi:uncharacterized membrane protein
MEKKAAFALKAAWVFGLIALGLVLNQLGIGPGEFAGFASVGTYLIYIGFIGLVVVLLAGFWRGRRIVDERMLAVAAKANRATFLFVIVLAFILIIADGIRPITMPYHLFLSYLVCAMLLVYFAAYKVLLRAS